MLVTQRLWADRVDVGKEKRAARRLHDDVVQQHRDVHDADSFHRAVGPVLVAAQWFALMPVVGVTGADASHLKFRWLTLRVAYALFTVSCVFLMALVHCISLFATDSPLTFKSSMSIVFYSVGCVSMLLYFSLATRWPTLMMRLQRLEVAMKENYGYPRHLARRLRIITACVLSLAAFEHMLANMKPVRRALDCADGSLDWIRVYYANNYASVVDLIGYNAFLPVVIQLVGFIATFAWNYMDLFIMLVSSACAARLRQINTRLERVRDKPMPATFWSQMLEDYGNLATFIKLVDEHINKIVALSFVNNLYFICLQLLNSIKYKRDPDDSLYFYVSFGHLLSRSTAMCLFASAIHDASTQPKSVLFSVTSESYTVEVQRLLEQVTSDHIALTGLNFFSITKSLLFTIAGTIITYEIVLVQMNNLEDADPATSQNVTLVTNPFCPNKSRSLG